VFIYTPANYALNLKDTSIFTLNSFNLNYFSVQEQDTIKNPKQAELGQLLFYDPILSGNNKRACASCHKAELAFTDGLEKATDFDKQHQLNRNTPTLLNTIFQKIFL